jgi:hypothetical protein
VIREYAYTLNLKGTDPTAGGTPFPVTGGNISMDRAWSPAVRAQLTLAYDDLPGTAQELLDPRVAQFARVTVQDLTEGRTSTWDLTIRGYTVDMKSRTVDVTLASYEALALDYGVTYNSIDMSNTGAYPSASFMILNLLTLSCGSDAVGSIESYSNADIPAGRESRYVVPGGNVWQYITDYASEAGGGIVQHYGFTNETNLLRWALIPQTHTEAPVEVVGYVPPAFPIDSASLPDGGSNELIEHTATIDREAADWADHLYAEWPRRSVAGSTVLVTAGTTFDYDVNLRGQAGSEATRRRQVAVSRPTYPPSPGSERDSAAAWYLGRRARLATSQTYTHALDPRLTPWQAFDAAAEIAYRLDSVTHHLADGTTVVRASTI